MVICNYLFLSNYRMLWKHKELSYNGQKSCKLLTVEYFLRVSWIVRMLHGWVFSYLDTGCSWNFHYSWYDCTHAVGLWSQGYPLFFWAPCLDQILWGDSLHHKLFWDCSLHQICNWSGRILSLVTHPVSSFLFHRYISPGSSRSLQLHQYQHQKNPSK